MEQFHRSLASKITIPAVKITGSNPLPLLPDDALLCPDPVSSLTASNLDPIDTNLFLCSKDDGAMLTSDEEENEAEFGEFLLDAVDWL